MTRDSNNQGRDDERPYSRNSSSGRYGEERSPRPARPRLNRDTVDKAWENGARQNHPDYHTRNSQGSQPPRDNWRRQQQTGQSSAYNGRNNTRSNSRPPFGNRPTDRRQSEQSPNRYQGSQPRPYSSGMRKFDERQYNERRDYQPRPPYGESRPQPGEDTRYSNNRPPSRGYESRPQPRGDERYSNNRPPSRGYESRPQPRGDARYSNNRPPSRGYESRDERQPRSFERDEQRPHEPLPRGYYRERRQERASGRPDPQNSRWQSRPQRFSPKPSGNARPTPTHEQFEGDYEGFDAQNSPSEFRDRREQRETGQPRRNDPRPHHEASRPDAEFLTEVHQETDNLIQHIAPVEQKENNTDTSSEREESSRPRTKKARTGTRAATAKVRRKNGETKQPDTNPASPHLRPSRRGFKWPEHEAAAEKITEPTPEE